MSFSGLPNWLSPLRSDLVKDRLQIVIFGSYRPQAAKDRLIALKQFLQANGYSGARLVADFPDTEPLPAGRQLSVYFWNKCQHWLQTADVVLFVYFNNGQPEGMTSELSHFLDNLKDRMWRGIVFVENPMNLSHMIIGRLQTFPRELKQTEFSSDADLHQQCIGQLVDYPKQLFYEINTRNPFRSV